MAIRGQGARVGDCLPVPRRLPNSIQTPKFIEPKELVANWPATLPRKIAIDAPLLTLLGLATSEGLVRTDTLNIYNIDPIVLDAITQNAHAVGAHVAPRYSASAHICGYNIQPNTFAALFVSLGAGGLSGDKRVPPFLFTASNEQIAHYLRAYFEGDGTVSEKSVSCTSKSHELMSDIAYLLLRFNIIGRIKPKYKRATNSQSTGGTYWELTMSGADAISSYAKNIGFLTQRKAKTDALLGKLSNTNVDVISGLAPILTKLYQMLYQGDDIKAPANLSPLKRGIFSPSPQQLAHIVLAAEARIETLEKQRSHIKFLNQLPDLDALIMRGKKIDASTTSSGQSLAILGNL